MEAHGSSTLKTAASLAELICRPELSYEMIAPLDEERVTLMEDTFYQENLSKEVIEQIGYDSESDFVNPTGSVFCAHGSGFLVEWDQVKEYMHLESILSENKSQDMQLQACEIAPNVYFATYAKAYIDAIEKEENYNHAEASGEILPQEDFADSLKFYYPSKKKVILHKLKNRVISILCVAFIILTTVF